MTQHARTSTICAIALPVCLALTLAIAPFSGRRAAALPGDCIGDCGARHAVSTENILTMMLVALGGAPLNACTAGDANDNGAITVDEVLAAMNSAVSGCSTSPTPTASSTPTVAPTQTTSAPIAADLIATLSGDQETSPVETNGLGRAVFELNEDETQLHYELSVANIASDQILAAHIHIGPVGRAGPVVFTLATGPFVGQLEGTLSAADFVPDAGDGVNTFADFVATLRTGLTYVNVHTIAQGNGEIRGQIGVAAILHAALTGAQETPPVETTAAGQAVFALSPDEATLSYQLSVTGLAADQILAVHIHVAQPGVPGPIVLPIHGPFNSPLDGTLTAADLAPDVADGVLTFADLVASMRAGQTYLNVHTIAQGNGEIRGQVRLSNALAAVLSGDQETSAVDTAAGGHGVFTVSSDETTLSYDLGVTGISPEDILAAHIHIGLPGVPGPVVFPLANGPFNNPLRGTLTAADLVPDVTDGVATFANFIAALRAGQAYVNVHTAAHGNGEIRGQIGVGVLRATLTGDQETPPVSSAGSGKLLALLSPDESTLWYQLSVSGLSTAQILAAHLHTAAPGIPGPVIVPIASGSFEGTILGTVSAGSDAFHPDPAGGVISFADFIGMLRAGSVYANVHTTAHGNGELRGQIGAAGIFRAMLSGDKETPAVTTTATGRAIVLLSPDERTLSYQLTADGLTSILAAHIHVASPGVPGPVVLPLVQGSFTNPLHATLSADDFVPSAADGLATFADFVAALRVGRAYVNIHTAAHGNGEIRGQLEDIAVLTSEQFVAQASDFACLTGWPKVRQYRLTNLLGHLDQALAVANESENTPALRFPVGTIIQLLPTEVMVKRGGAFDVENNGWEYFTLSVNGAGTGITQRGRDTVNGGACFGCHSAARNFDFVCGSTHGCVPLKISNELAAALQNADPRCVH